MFRAIQLKQNFLNNLFTSLILYDIIQNESNIVYSSGNRGSYKHFIYHLDH